MISTGLHAGASGFLLKNVRPHQLWDAIHAVAAGDAVLSPRITRDLVDRFSTCPQVESFEASAEDVRDLTQRAGEVNGETAAGLSNAEIDVRLHLSEATVKTDITRVLAKLDLRDRVQVVTMPTSTACADGRGPTSQRPPLSLRNVMCRDAGR